jgi:hypothetical protein
MQLQQLLICAPVATLFPARWEGMQLDIDQLTMSARASPLMISWRNVIR